MKSLPIRILALSVLFLGAFLTARATAASADFWGGYKWAGSGGPPDCLFAGVGIITGVSPDRHNAAAANSCHTTFSVKVQHYEKRSDGTNIISCVTLFNNNFSRCSIQNSTGPTDYWEWIASIKASDGFTYSMSCNNKGSAYSGCYDSTD